MMPGYRKSRHSLVTLPDVVPVPKVIEGLLVKPTESFEAALAENSLTNDRLN